MLHLKSLGPYRSHWKIPMLGLWMFILTGFSFGQLGEIAPVVPCLEQPEQTYTLYRPSQYTRKKRWPTVVLLDTSGHGQAAVAAFREGAETYGFILASPNGFQMHPDMDIRSNPVIWIYQDLIRRFAVDIEGIYFAGLGKAGDLMADLTQRLQTNAGLILSSPNRDQLDSLKSFSSHLAVSQGYFDPNTIEVRNHLNNGSKNPAHRIIPFEGGRQWPHPEIGSEMLGWLLAQSYKARSINAPNQAAWFKHRSGFAEKLQTQNRLIEAMHSWQSIQDDFPEKAQKATAQKAIQQLKETKAYQEQMSTRQATSKMETETIALFKSEMKPELFDQPKLLQEDLAWWKEQHKFLSHLVENVKESEAKNTAIRLVEYLWQMSYLDGLSLLEEERFAKASYHFQIATHLFSDKPFAHYALACAYAGLDKNTQALETLKQSVALGLDDASLIQLQPLFDRFRDEPEFQALSKKIRD